MSKPSRTSIMQSMFHEFSIPNCQIAEMMGVSRQYSHRKVHAGEYADYKDKPWKDREPLERDAATRIAWKIIDEEQEAPQNRNVRLSYRNITKGK